MYPAFKNYTVIREIGSGGMSVVYEATDNKLKRSVALKVLHPHLCRDPEASARFRREALAAARLDHPHVVRVYDYLTDEGFHSIVMEYVPGTDMESIRKKRGTIDAGAVFAVMEEIARAMAEAHGLGIIHRDIKPANILIHRQGRAMLTDFGLAHHCFDSRITQKDAIAGTPVYMSPEQIGGKELSPATDVYSWAVTLYFLIAGKLPYVSQEFPDVISAIRRADIVFHGEAIKALPASYYELLRMCFLASPAERIGDGKALKLALDRCRLQHPLAGDISDLSGEPEQSKTLGPERPMLSKTNLFFPSPRPPKRWLLVAAAVLAALGALVAALHYFPKKTTPVATALSSPPVVSHPRSEATDSFPKPPAAALGSQVPSPIRRSATLPRKIVPEAGPTQADSGQLFVYCSPWAEVTVDGHDCGTTPFEKPISLPAGIHRIRLYNKYCIPREDTIAVTANTILRKRYSLPRLE